MYTIKYTMSDGEETAETAQNQNDLGRCIVNTALDVQHGHYAGPIRVHVTSDDIEALAMIGISGGITGHETIMEPVRAFVSAALDTLRDDAEAAMQRLSATLQARAERRA